MLAEKEVLMTERKGQRPGERCKGNRGERCVQAGLASDRWRNIYFLKKTERTAAHMDDYESKFCGSLLECGHRQKDMQTVSLPFLRSSGALKC